MIFNLTQVNIAIAKYSYADPEFAGFVDNLDRIYELAEHADGFVWRYVSEDEDAEAKRIFSNDALIFNMSMWKSLQDLRNFIYESDHVQILRKRAAWFVPQDRPTMTLWWQPDGKLPTVAEAKRRLECLAQTGSTVDAFTFRDEYEMPEGD